MLQVYIWIVLGLLAVQLFLLFCLIVWKSKTIGNENNINTALASLRPQFIEYIEGHGAKEPKLPKKKTTKIMIMEKMLDEFYSGSYGNLEKEKLNSLAEKYLASHYRRTLKKGGWAERINALYFIEDFHMLSLREDTYQHFLKLKKQDEEFRQCLRTCTSLQEERLIEFIFEKDGLSVGLLKEVLFRLNTGLLVKTVEKIQANKEVPENVLFAVITFSGEQKNELFFPFVEKKLRDSRKEVRLKAMNSLCNYKKIKDPSILPVFFTSQYWEERMYAAKLTGACRLEPYKEPVMNLLSDSVWWVRFAAAENLAEFKDGEFMLRRAATGHEDAYARDIAKHMLTRKGGIGA